MPCLQRIVKHHLGMRVGERIKFLREKRKLTGIQLATRAGIDQSYLSKLENGKVGFSEDGLRKIAAALGTNLPELFGADLSRPSEIDLRRVPILNYIQAGLPSEAASNFVDEVSDYVTVDLDRVEDLFGLIIKGVSMTPEFVEGDLVIVRRSLRPHPGDYVVAFVEGSAEASFKRYRELKTDERGRTVFALVPLNADYPTLRSDEIPLTIRGTMIEHRRFRRR